MTQTFRLSLFKNKRDNKPQPVTRTWQELCKRFSKPQIRADKDGALFSPATFEPALRRKENVREISLLVLDIDHNAELETLKTQMSALDSAFAIYSTHSHLRETTSNPNAEPRFRVCLPLASAIAAKDFPALWHYIKQGNYPLTVGIIIVIIVGSLAKDNDYENQTAERKETANDKIHAFRF